MSASRTVFGRLFQSFGAKKENDLPPAVDFEDVTVTKTITVQANQKPWLTGEVYRLLKARNAGFRAGDEEGLKTARANLSRGIREAKRQYSRRIAH